LAQIQTYIHTYLHTYIHTYLPTYIHTYIHFAQKAKYAATIKREKTK